MATQTTLAQVGILSMLPKLPEGMIHPLVQSQMDKEQAQRDLVQEIFDGLSLAYARLEQTFKENIKLKEERISLYTTQTREENSQQNTIAILQAKINTLSSKITQLEYKINYILSGVKKSDVQALLNEIKQTQQLYFNHTHTLSNGSRSSEPTCEEGACWGKGTTYWYPTSFAQIPQEFYEC